MVICLERGADCLHMVQLMPPHPKPHQLLPHLNPFWYRLTQVVLEKRPLNGCSSNLGDNTHTFNGPLSGTTRVSRYQKGKTNLDFTEARDSARSINNYNSYLIILVTVSSKLDLLKV